MEAALAGGPEDRQGCRCSFALVRMYFPKEEPLTSGFLLDCPNIVLTPHFGMCFTEEAQLNFAIGVTEAIAQDVGW